MKVKHRITLLVCCAAIFAMEVFASDVKEDTSVMATTNESKWELGIAIGTGEITNPLVESNDVDIPAVIHLAYFGEDVFFDNGELGVYLYEGAALSFNFLLGLNHERYYFDHLNRLGLVANSMSSSPGDYVEPDDEAIANNQQQAINPPHRKRPIDGGFELLADGNWGEFQAQWMTDVSHNHSGYEFWLAYSFPMKNNRFSFVPTLGAKYKSRAWTNYFYGVADDEVIISMFNNLVLRPAYYAPSSTNYWWRIATNYQLSESWRIIAIYEKELLDESIYLSPIVKERSSTTHFLGFYYQF